MERKNEMMKKMWLGAVLIISIMLFQGPALAADDTIILPNEIPFGDVQVGQVMTAELVIAHTASSQVEAVVALSGTCSDFSLGAVPSPFIIPAGANASVIITYAPTGGGFCSDTVDLQFFWITPFGKTDLGTRTVTVTGNGVVPEEPEEPAADMGSVLEFFDKSVAEKTIKGKGRRKFAKFRIKMLRHMLVIADRKIQKGKIKKAQKLLKAVYKKIDGKRGRKWNKDLAKGEALSELAEMVAQVIDDLETS
ncbi:MAG: hypothetical protein JRJ51_14570 [Deltaproteobacteria bacterium]|nr:hypothetical protein [Deltaproteobacteria bacterium]